MNEERIKVFSKDMTPELQNNSYHLTCNVKVVKKTLYNINAKGERVAYESVWVILVPEVNDQFVGLLQAFFPDDLDDSETCEFAFMHKRRGFSFRGFIARSSSECDKIHIKMMSMDMEDHFKDGERIEIFTLSTEEEEKIHI